MHGPLAVVDVVDIERIDADQGCPRVGQEFRCLGRQEWVTLEILVRTPVAYLATCESNH